MNDFFSNLASRTNDGAPSILPRVPALFELEQSDEAPEQHELSTALLVPARWAEPQALAQPSAVVPPRLPIATAEPSRPAAAPPTPAAPYLMPAPAEPSTPVERRSLQPAIELPQQPVAAPAVPAPAASAVLPSKPVRERTAPPATPLPARVPNAGPLVEGRPALPSPMAFVQPASVHTPLAPQSAPLSISAPNPPQPIIHVSIGRVEVRAAAPAPARPAGESRSRPTVMTLDEYLRSSEGRR
jgi:hypothetical protein